MTFVENSFGALLLSTRFLVALVSFVGCFVIYSFRINLSVALVCMVNRTALLEPTGNHSLASKQAAECEISGEAYGESLNKVEGSLEWTKSMQGMLLGAFFWGYLCTQILGGWAAQRFGATKIIAGNVFVSILVTFLTPASTKIGYAATVFLRILLGFVQGVTFPAFHSFWSVWAAPSERSILTAVTYAGCQVGNVATLPLSSFLCEHGFAGGWPSIFYVLGIFGILWLTLWIFYTSDTPAQHKFISTEEKAYLGHGTASGSSRIPIPWKAIVKSVPLYANFAAHWAGDWAAYMMLTCIPTFLDNVFQIKMSQLGFLAAVPYIAYFLCINLAGIIADYLRSRKILSTGNTRKLMTAIAFLSQAVFLLAAGYCSCGRQYLVVAFLTLGAGLSGFQYAGVLINYMDIAPPFAGTILGIGNTISCLSGILAPMAMGELTGNGTRQEWLILFWITALILVAGTVFYVIFAQGEIQAWAMIDLVQKMENNETQTSSTNKDSKTTTASTLTKSLEKSD